MLPLDQCRDRAEAGPKAVELARARAAGFPVLDGVVLLPGETVEEVDWSALARLGARLAVRSSSLDEDGVKSGAGIFASVIGVALDEVPQAVAQVRASATSARAQVYGARRELAVLIQPVAVADTLLVAMCEGDGFIVEARDATAPEWATPTVTEGEGDLGALLRRLREFFGRPFVAELARRGDALTLLQIRPRPDGDFAAPWPLSTFAIDGDWRRDSHNRAPLSTAQAELVAHVERLGVGPEQRVLGGYLYYSPSTRGESPWPDDLGGRFAALAAQLRAAVAGARSFDEVLAVYTRVYWHYVVEVAPSRRRARVMLDDALRRLGLPLDGQLFDGVGGAAQEREAALRTLDGSDAAWQRYVDAFGAWAPGWDVALPCDDESRARLEQWARHLPPPPSSASRASASSAIDPALIEQARQAVRVGEDDDALFFAAQHAVRRALQERGEALVRAGRLDEATDIFQLPFDLPDGDLRPLVARARQHQRRSLATIPPDAIDDGQPRPRPPPSRTLTGRATQGRAHGRVVHVDEHTALPLPPDAVVWVKALIPSLAPLLLGAAALVTEEGGVASHGALLARERGLVAVLGVGPSPVAAGTHVLVDGAAGLVQIL